MDQERSNYTIPVYEIFGPTIQGEGLHAGKRCMFVRTCFCNDHCSWCDSKFAWSDKHAIHMTIQEIFSEIVDKGCNTVILTGGNPCLHNFTMFIRLCIASGINVEVETQGGAYPTWLNNVNLITFSPKVPSAGNGVVDRRNSFYEWLDNVPSCHIMHIVVKIPVFDEADIQFAKETFDTIRKRFVSRNEHTFDFYLSVGNSDTHDTGAIRDRVLDDYEKLIYYINEHSEGFEDVSILPQIHTLVWGNRGGV